MQTGVVDPEARASDGPGFGHAGLQVELDADEVDGVVGGEEPVHRDGPDESSPGNQYPGRGDSFDGLRQRFEVGGVNSVRRPQVGR